MSQVNIQAQRENGQWMTVGSCSDNIDVIGARVRQEAARRGCRIRAVSSSGSILDIT